MASKKPIISGVARPQGFIDDAAKAIIKVVTRSGSKTPKPTRGQMYTKAVAAEKRLKNNNPRYEYGEYDMKGAAQARADDRADVAAFMAKKKRGRR